MEECNKIKVVAVIGPTASGKTKLAVEICRKFNGEVISCDSMQIYKYMDIASAKPTKEEMNGVPHHLIDFILPGEEYSAALFQRDAVGCIDDISSRGRLPVIAGGTGLYYDSLVNYEKYVFYDSDREYRAYLESLLDGAGNIELMKLYNAALKEGEKPLHPNDTKRIIRYLEKRYCEEKSKEALSIEGAVGESENAKNPTEDEIGSYLKNVTFIPILLDSRDRAFLYERINKRVDKMLEKGLMEEARSFFENAHSITSVQAIGYKELLPAIKNEKRIDECVESLKKATRNYAKRQLSRFHSYNNIKTIYIDEYKNEEEIIQAATEYLCEIL